MKIFLNLGCGKDIKRSTNKVKWINVDKEKLEGVDLVTDLNKFPWKELKDNTFDEIYCKDVIEHLDDVVKAMEEIHRIGKPGAIVHITVPYYASKVTFLDPTHKRGFTEHSFDYFCEDRQYSSYNFYTKARFKIIEVKFLTYGKRRLLPFKAILRHFLNNIIDVLYFKLKIIK